MVIGSRFLAALLAGAFSLSAIDAEAYCRSRTCKHTLERSCRMEGSCIVEGKVLYRPGSCASYAVEESGSKKHSITPERFDELIQEAFDRWLTVDCGDGQPPSLDVVSLGSVACDEVSYNSDSGNVGVFLFRQEWDLEDFDAFALTTTHYERTTGEIYDVDVEINATLPEFVTEDPLDGVDLPSILTHEVGHFLGLAHASTPDAVMFPNYSPGVDNLRLLGADDVAGLCEIYPPGRKTSSDRCAPRHGFARDCEFAPLDASGACAQTSGGTGGTLALLGVGFFALLGRVRRLRARRHGSRSA